jgi:hypothetical protein
MKGRNELRPYNAAKRGVQPASVTERRHPVHVAILPRPS